MLQLEECESIKFQQTHTKETLIWINKKLKKRIRETGRRHEEENRWKSTRQTEWEEAQRINENTKEVE